MRATQDESGPSPAIPEPSVRKDDRFREFVEFLPQPVFEVDALGNIVFANHQALRAFGYEQEDLSRGMNAVQMLAPEDQERAKKNMERTLRGEDLGGTEYQALKKDGGRFPIIIYSTTVYHQGKPSGVRGVIIDISARRKAEEDLRASEERYRQVVELSNDAITIVRGMTHLYVNPKMVEIFGYSHADEIVGRPITLLIHPDDRKRVAEFNRLRQEGKAVPSKYEFRGVRRDGRTIHLETSAAQIRSGQEGLSLVFLRDITDRKQAEAALRESEEILSRAFRATPDWVTISTVEEGRYIEVNDAFLEITGFSRAEVIGRTSSEIGLWRDTRDRDRARKHIRDRGNLKDFEVRFIMKSGDERLFAWSAEVIEIKGQQGLLSVCRDITEQRKAEEAIRESEEKYRLVVENATEAIFIAQDGFLKLINPKVVEITGYEEEILRAKPFPELIHPEDRAMVVDRHIRRIRGEALPAVYEFRVIDRKGQVRWVEINTVRIDWEGRPATLNFLSDITERIQADSALRESEERARLIFNTVPDSITITRADDGRYILVNDYFCRLTGFSREETIGRTVSDLNVFMNIQDREQFIQEMREKGEVSNFEIQYRKKDGSLFTALLSARPIEYSGEGCLVAVVTDITRRKQIEDALRRSEEQHRKLVESMREGFGVLNERNEVTYINKRFCDLIGYAPEEIVGYRINDFVDQENLRILGEQMAQLRSGGKNPCEIAWTRKDGIKVYTLMSPEPVFDGEGNFKGSFAVITDISERKQMEEALRKSEERYRLLVENANEGILVLQEGLITFANPAAARIVHSSGQDLQSRPFMDFVHPEDRGKVFNYYRNRISGEASPSQYTLRLLDFHGNTVWVEANVIIISWEGRPAVLVFSTDISEKKQLEMQFLQAQKMEAVGRLAGGVAHDFNNLLTSILGHSDLMLMRLRPRDPLVGDIKEIVKAANRATELTRQLLAFSRKQIMQPKLLNLNALITDMKKMLRRLIGEDITLETLLSPNLGRVLVDPGQIDQVIMNLVVNARDAMPKGGTLTVKTGNTFIDEVQVRRYIGARPGAYVLLSVKDSGAGMSEEILSHVFEPFFTTKDLGKGTGLGLSTVYGIVKQSNGYIWVDSRPDQGTEFKIFLPRQEGEAESDLKPERGKVALTGKETILLAEDNELVRGLTRNVLEHFGYQVLETEDGEEAGRMSKGYEGPIHLLLTDVVMPGISGRVLAEQLQVSRPGIKVLFMSGYSEEAVLLQGMQRLGAHFLQKPFTPEELGLRIREILDSAV